MSAKTIANDVLMASLNQIFEEMSERMSVVLDGYLMKEINDTKTPMDAKHSIIKNLLADMMQMELPLQNIWRVELRENSEIHITDFTMPSSSTTLTKTIPISEAPSFIRNGLAVLQIVQDDTHVDGVGKRISENIFYILEQDCGGDTREESQRCD